MSPKKNPLVGEADFICDFCTFMVSELEGLIEGDHTEDEIIGDLKSVCDDADKMFPGIGLAETCKAFTDAYVKPALDLLINDLEPDTVCQEITLCPAPATTIM